MAKKQPTPTAEQVREEFCCLMERDYIPPQTKISPPAAPKPVVLELTKVMDCCGCGCDFLYYEDQFGKKYDDGQALALIKLGNAKRMPTERHV